MSKPDSSVYRLGRGPALLATGAFTIVAGLLVFAAFLVADDSTARLATTFVLGGLGLVAVVMALRFALRPPALARLDRDGFMVARPRVRASWKQVDDVRLEGGVLVLTGEGTAQVDLRMLEPAQRQDFVRDVYDRLNAAHGYTRFG